MHVRPGSASAPADCRDGVSANDTLSNSNKILLVMRVNHAPAVVSLDHDGVTKSSLGSAFNSRSIGDRLDRRACRGGDIGTLVQGHLAVDGILSPSDFRCHPAGNGKITTLGH